MAKFGGRASQSSICERELSWAMRDVGLVTRGAAKRSHCLRGPLIDIDVASPGVQPACRVDIGRDFGTLTLESRTELPPCDGAADGKPCFTLDVDDTGCADTETQIAFRIRDGGGKETVTVACDVDIDADTRAQLPGDGEIRAPE
jgi:hypothetical protein